MGLYCMKTAYAQCDVNETVVDAYTDAASADENEVLTTKFTCLSQYLNGIWLLVLHLNPVFLSLASLTLCLYKLY